MTMTLTEQTEALPEHGSRQRYDAPHNCRCGRCRRGNRERAAIARQARLDARIWVADGSDGYWRAPIGKHDASTYSNWGCRCPTCRDDHSARLRGEVPDGDA